MYKYMEGKVEFFAYGYVYRILFMKRHIPAIYLNN